MLIEPEQINKQADFASMCFFGVFKSNNNQPNTIIMGYEFFHEYYVMFDASPKQFNDTDFIQVGIAKRDKKVDIGQVRYEPNYKGYMRANRNDDQSEIMEGFTD